MSLNKFSTLGYILFFIAIVLFFWPKEPKIRNVVRIQREIHQIQTIRKEQTKEADKSIEDLRKKAATRISNIKELDFNKEIGSKGGDSVCVEHSQLEKCLEYKIKFERDSSSLVIMTNDRDSCNAQLDSIVSKVDTLVIESTKENKEQYKRGLIHGIVSGVVVATVAAVTLFFVTK